MKCVNILAALNVKEVAIVDSKVGLSEGQEKLGCFVTGFRAAALVTSSSH